MGRLIPLCIKCPIAVALNQIGRLPLGIVLRNMRWSFTQNRTCSDEVKNKENRKAQETMRRYFLRKYGPYISKQSANYSNGQKNNKFPIWIFWWQGEAQAPELVKRCIRSVRKNAGGHPVQVVDSENFKDFVKIEQNILDKLEDKTISLTHFSDILRMNLLADHGGFWLDATIYCAKAIDVKEFDNPIFTLRNPNGDMSNISRWEWTGFAIYGWQGGKLFCLMRDFFNAYWKDHSKLADYYLIDYGIRLICDICPDVKEQIDSVPANNQNLYFYQQHFDDACPGSLSDVDTGDTWLYKLSWKREYPMVTECGEKTLYAAWCEETMEQQEK